ncbi:MAG: GIY-YIG nuclease family protein [Patescibacteria group bacterium]|nr:GIY-YIG nuclease family protein [Patescibacteria group bacterium]
MFWIYVIQNREGKIYVGQTNDLDQRLRRHNRLLLFKKNAYTCRNAASEWKIIYKESYDTRAEALKREKQLKSHQGREFIKRIPL